MRSEYIHCKSVPALNITEFANRLPVASQRVNWPFPLLFRKQPSNRKATVSGMPLRQGIENGKKILCSPDTREHAKKSDIFLHESGAVLAATGLQSTNGFILSMVRSSLFFFDSLVSFVASSPDQKPPPKQIENWRLSRRKDGTPGSRTESLGCCGSRERRASAIYSGVRGSIAW
jgi:hypothetical protein